MLRNGVHPYGVFKRKGILQRVEPLCSPVGVQEDKSSLPHCLQFKDKYLPRYVKFSTVVGRLV